MCNKNIKCANIKCAKIVILHGKYGSSAWTLHILYLNKNIKCAEKYKMCKYKMCATSGLVFVPAVRYCKK